jgi:16S rRNA (guanine(527)-N(7))-methyltransferase RsmG
MIPVWFQTTCAQNDLRLNGEQLRLLEEYADRLLEWNKKINLISRRDEENFWSRHILHCLSLVFKVEIPEKAEVLDLGTGGGLPGVVLKIVRPDLLFTLLDSTQKKINVVKELIGLLGLDGVDAVWGRAEDLGKQRKYTERYDVVVARAVGPLRDLVRWSYPFMKKSTVEKDVGGSAGPEWTRKRINTPALIAFKGGDVGNEIGQLRTEPNVGAIATIELTLKGSTQLDDRDKKIIVVDYVQSAS